MSQVSSVAEPEVKAPTTAVAPAAPVAPAVPETVSADTFDRDVTAGKVTPDVLASLTPKWSPPKIAAHGQPVAAAPVPAPAPVVEPQPAVAVPPEETPAAEVPAAPPVPQTEEQKKDFAKNWRNHASDAKEALVFELHKGGVPLAQAVAEVYGEPKTEAAPATPAQPISQPEPTVDPVAQADQQITALATQAAELEVQIDKAAEDGDNKTALQLMRKQSDIKLALERTKDQRESIRQEIQDQAVSREVENHRQLENQSLTEMFGAYPELGDKASDKRAAFNVKVAEMEKSPLYGPKFRDNMPGWPMMVARMVDAEKGWSRNANPQPAVAPAPAPVAKTPMNQPAPQTVAAAPTGSPLRATSAEVITPSSNPGGSTPALNAQSFWRDSADVTPAELLKLMAKAPIDPRLTRAQKNDPRRFDSA